MTIDEFYLFVVAGKLDRFFCKLAARNDFDAISVMMST
jgi:hypothetical protein